MMLFWHWVDYWEHMVTMNYSDPKLDQYSELHKLLKFWSKVLIFWWIAEFVVYFLIKFKLYIFFKMSLRPKNPNQQDRGLKANQQDRVLKTGATLYVGKLHGNEVIFEPKGFGRPIHIRREQKSSNISGTFVEVSFNVVFNALGPVACNIEKIWKLSLKWNFSLLYDFILFYS